MRLCYCHTYNSPYYSRHIILVKYTRHEQAATAEKPTAEWEGLNTIVYRTDATDAATAPRVLRLRPRASEINDHLRFVFGSSPIRLQHTTRRCRGMYSGRSSLQPLSQPRHCTMVSTVSSVLTISKSVAQGTESLKVIHTPRRSKDFTSYLRHNKAKRKQVRIAR